MVLFTFPVRWGLKGRLWKAYTGAEGRRQGVKSGCHWLRLFVWLCWVCGSIIRPDIHFPKVQRWRRSSEFVLRAFLS